MVEIPPGATLVSQLKKLANGNPDKEAFVMIDKAFHKIVLTRRDVWDNSRKYAAILRRHGVQKGDIVCNTLVNSPERLVSALGTIVAGAITMHGQVFLADGEDIIHSLKIAKCRTIIVDPGHERGALPILNRLEYTDEKTGEIRYNGLPHLTTVIHLRVCCQDNEYDSFQRGFKSLQEETEMFEDTKVTEHDMAFIFATSGSTGFSKLVPHSHRSCLYDSRPFGFYMGIESDQARCFLDSSLGWSGGYPGPYCLYGSTRILTDLSLGFPDKMDERILRILNEERVDCCGMLPSWMEFLGNIVKSGEKLNKRLRVVLVGGMPITKKILKDFHLFTDCVNSVYGSSEVGTVSSLHLEQGMDFQNFCVGFASEGCEVLIVDKDIKELPTGEIGELSVRTPSMMSGYLYDLENTQKTMTKDGFFLSGDAAYKNDKGQLFVLGRQVHAIHRGVFIHYPGWIESRMLECPGVEDAVVIGVPDPILHEEICLCVIPTSDGTLTTEQLQTYCKSLFLIDAKSTMSAVPKYYLFFDTFPSNANGKLDRERLFQEACRRCDIHDEQKP